VKLFSVHLVRGILSPQRLNFEEYVFVHILKILGIGPQRVYQTLLLFDYSPHLFQGTPPFFWTFGYKLLKVVTTGLNGIDQIAELVIFRLDHSIEFLDDLGFPLLDDQHLLFEIFVLDADERSHLALIVVGLDGLMLSVLFIYRSLPLILQRSQAVGSDKG
jgi:hypothetical protein